MEKFESLREAEKQYFLDMVKRCKDSGAGLVICQWGELGTPFPLFFLSYSMRVAS